MKNMKNKEVGFTFRSNTMPYCKNCISFAICNAVLKNHEYPRQGLREIAEKKCSYMLDFLTYVYYHKKLGVQSDISYRRIIEVLDDF